MRLEAANLRQKCMRMGTCQCRCGRPLTGKPDEDFFDFFRWLVARVVAGDSGELLANVGAIA